MTKEELKEYLKENLRLTAKSEFGGYDDSTEYVTINLVLEGEVISSDLFSVN